MSVRSYLWKTAPFTRLLPALIAGILGQWHFQLPIYGLYYFFAVCILVVTGYLFLSDSKKHRLAALGGIIILATVAASGAMIMHVTDVRNDKNWIGKEDGREDALIVTLKEDPVEKERTYKAIAEAQGVLKGKDVTAAKGALIIYFKKDSISQQLKQGSPIIFKKPIQLIAEALNPGGFNYRHFNLLKGITHQVYLSPTNYYKLATTKQTVLKKFIHSSQQYIIAVLKKYITGHKAQGLAEALIIGYKLDLDKNLQQQYVNTGVVHIIAISGLHLGIIYGLLLWLTYPLQGKRRAAWVRFIIIALSLWFFCLLAGAQPSVLRSAVMFTSIAFGKVLARKSSVYNTLALSAFALLCYNPFWLWDVGFQLSYAAVCSIIMFYKPLYNLVVFTNPLPDFFWKLICVSLAAQLLTTPISIYHFHQFPLLFLLTNIIAVPLSSVILMGGIVLCGVGWVPPIAAKLGGLLTGIIDFMNGYIERLNRVSFAVWNELSLTGIEAGLLTLIIITAAYWLMHQSKQVLMSCLSCILLLSLSFTYSFINTSNQKKFVVYNIPHHSAIDIVDGKSYAFLGDAALVKDIDMQSKHLLPSRLLHKATGVSASVAGCKQFKFYNKNILLLNNNSMPVVATPKPVVDVLVLMGNPKLYIADMHKALTIKQIVVDASVPAWKANLWMADCKALQIPYFNVAEKGAFVMTAQ